MPKLPDDPEAARTKAAKDEALRAKIRADAKEVEEKDRAAVEQMRAEMAARYGVKPETLIIHVSRRGR